MLIPAIHCGGLGGALEWNEVKKNDYFVLQKLKSFVLGNISNKRFRILLVNTVKILDNKKNEGAGKKFIVAEADTQQEIDTDWVVLEKQAIPELATKSFESFAKLQVFLKNPPTPKQQQQISNKQLVVSQKIEIQEDFFDDVKPAANKPASKPQQQTSEPKEKSTKKSTVTQQQQQSLPPLGSVDEARAALEDIWDKINTIQTKSKLLGKGGSAEEKAKPIIRTCLVEMKQLDAQLKQYFSTNAKSKDPFFSKLQNQYDELKTAKDQIAKNAKITELIAASTYTVAAKNSSNLYEEEAEEHEQEQMQQQQQKPKPKLDALALSTVNVEYTIAKETNEETKKLHSEFLELHGMMKDMSQLLAEQDGMVNRIGDNVDRAEMNVDRGIDEIKQARKYQRYGLK